MAESREGGEWTSSGHADSYDPGPSLDDRAHDHVLTEPKRKRFRALRVVRKIFRRKAKNVFKDDDSEAHQTIKSRSTSELTVADDPEIRDSGSISSTAYSSGLSLSHDSIFAPDSGSPEPPEQGDRAATAATASGFGHAVRHFSSAKDMQEELKRRLKERHQAADGFDNERYSDDDDLGLPRSPRPSPTVEEVQRMPGKSATNFSSVSSLMSMGSSGSGGEDADRFIFSGRGASNFDSELNVGATKLLNTDAARHKISVKPKRNHAAARSRKLHQNTNSSSLATTPEELEVTPMSPSAAAAPKALPRIPPLSPTDKKSHASPTHRSTSLLSKDGRPTDINLPRAHSLVVKQPSMTVATTSDPSPTTSLFSSNTKTSSKSNAYNRKLQHEIDVFQRQRVKTVSATASGSSNVDESPKSPTKSPELSRPTSPDRHEERDRSPSPESAGCFPIRKRDSSGKSEGLFLRNIFGSKRKSSAEDTVNADSSDDPPPPLPLRPRVRTEPRPVTSADLPSSPPAAATRNVVDVPQRPSQAKQPDTTVSKQPEIATSSGAAPRRSNSTRIARLSQNFENSAVFSLPPADVPPNEPASVLVLAPERRDVNSSYDSILMIEAQESGLPSVSPTGERSLVWERGLPSFTAVSESSANLWDAPALPPRSPPKSSPPVATIQQFNIVMEDAKKVTPSAIGRQTSSSDKRKPIQQQLSKEDMDSLESEHSDLNNSPSAIYYEPQPNRIDKEVLFEIRSSKDPNPRWGPVSPSTPEPVLPLPVRGFSVTSPTHVKLNVESPRSLPTVERELSTSQKSLAEASAGAETGSTRSRPAVEVTFPPASLPVANKFPHSSQIIHVDYSLPPITGASVRSTRTISADERPLRDKTPPVSTSKENIILIENVGGAVPARPVSESLADSPAPPLPPKGEALTPSVILRHVPKSRQVQSCSGTEQSELQTAFKRLSLKPTDEDNVSAVTAESLKVAAEATEAKSKQSPDPPRAKLTDTVPDTKPKEQPPATTELAVRRISHLRTNGIVTSTESKNLSSTLPSIEILEISDGKTVIPKSPNPTTTAASKVPRSGSSSPISPPLIEQKSVTPEISFSAQPSSISEIKTEPSLAFPVLRKVVRQVSPPPVEIAPPPTSETASAKLPSAAIVRSSVEPRRSHIPVPVFGKASPRKEGIAGELVRSSRKSFCQEEANIVILDSPEKEKSASVSSVASIETSSKVETSIQTPLTTPPASNTPALPTLSAPASRKASVIGVNGKEPVPSTFRVPPSALGSKLDSVANFRRKLSESERPPSSIIISSNSETILEAAFAKNDNDCKKVVVSLTEAEKPREIISKPVSALSRSSSSVSFGSRDSFGGGRLGSIDALRFDVGKPVELVSLPVAVVKPVEVVTLPPTSTNATLDGAKSSIQSAPTSGETDVKGPSSDKFEDLPEWQRNLFQKRRERLQATTGIQPMPAELIIDSKVKPGNKRASKVLDLVSNFQKLQVS